jgi:hypothetical protein
MLKREFLKAAAAGAIGGMCMQIRRSLPGLSAAILLAWTGCSRDTPKAVEPAAATTTPTIAAEMIASDPTWGNTE